VYSIDTVDSIVGSSASRPVVVQVSGSTLVVASNERLFDIFNMMMLLRQCSQRSKGTPGATGFSFRMLLSFARPLDQHPRFKVGNVGFGDDQFRGGFGFPLSLGERGGGWFW
jgi:hypothetical protein